MGRHTGNDAGPLYIGLMSGTSLDGIDGVLVRISDTAAHTASSTGQVQVLAHRAREFDPALRAELLALNHPGDNELHRAALAANALARACAQVVQALLDETGTPAAAVEAIGAHGQTVRHRPGEFDGTGYTVQLNAPALLAELTGIGVVSDLRSRDVAAGGQGAPLVPAFHRAVFARAGGLLAVLNLGGIANLSLLGADGSVRGFDCGPGNVLMDLWAQRVLGTPCDLDGRLAAQGRADAALLARLLDDPWFARTPPKSTGRDLFHAGWLDARLAGCGLGDADVQATLLALTVEGVARDLARELARVGADAGDAPLVVCGGGALNPTLMRGLQARLPQWRVSSSADHGLPPLQVEAAAFAWLAWCLRRGQSGNLPAVTGARGPRLLGSFTPA